MSLCGFSNAGPGCPSSTMSNTSSAFMCLVLETSMPTMYFLISCSKLIDPWNVIKYPWAKASTHKIGPWQHFWCLSAVPSEISLLHIVLSSLISHNSGWPNPIFTSQKSIEGKKDWNLWIVPHCTLHQSGFKFGPVFRQVTVSWLLWAKPSWSKHLKVGLHKVSLGNKTNLKRRSQ